MRRWMRRGGAAQVVLAIGVLGLLFGARTPKLSPGQQINVLRMQIVRTTRNLDAARDVGLVQEEEYQEARAKLLRAVKRYNILVRNFKRYKQVARTDQQEVVALLLAVGRAVKEESP